MTLIAPPSIPIKTSKNISIDSKGDGAHSVSHEDLESSSRKAGIICGVFCAMPSLYWS